MIDKLRNIVGKQITSVQNNCTQCSIKLFFEDSSYIEFNNCVFSNDLGIIGHKINFLSDKPTLGTVLSLKELNLNPDNYKFLLLSRDIDDFKNKNEFIIVYA
jgi:hypothetical protein